MGLYSGSSLFSIPLGIIDQIDNFDQVDKIEKKCDVPFDQSFSNIKSNIPGRS